MDNAGKYDSTSGPLPEALTLAREGRELRTGYLRSRLSNVL